MITCQVRPVGGGGAATGAAEGQHRVLATLLDERFDD
jgi:hypothetical protein